MSEVVDPDTFPPVLSTRPDCCNPSGCVCPDDQACHFEALDRHVPKVREDVEMPPRG